MFNNTGGWHMGFGGIFMLLFWAVVIVGIIALAKWIFSESGAKNASSLRSARQILDDRYARGEIDRDEFERQKKDIER